jgi:thiamine-phosphate pyrophosphorylase
MAAEKEGFDYIGVGPVFGTPTKPTYTPVGLDLVRFAAAHIKIPFVAIGGIDASNVKEVRAAGAKTVAVVRAVMAAKDPAQAAKHLS